LNKKGEPMAKLTKEQFITLFKENPEAKLRELAEIIKSTYDVDISLPAIHERKNKLIKDGSLEIEPGISTPAGTILKGVSRYHKLEDGGIWVKADVEKENALASFRESIDEITSNVTDLYTPSPFQRPEHSSDELLTVYISNDLHLGALMDKDETGDADWDSKIAFNTMKSSIEYLVHNSPTTDNCLIADLGDLLEMDSFDNQTPTSKHTLDVDGRWAKVLNIAQKTITYMILEALKKHQTVYFLNISGNHDISSGYAIQSYVKAFFRNEPRVIVDESHRSIKYFQFGSTLLGFAHGDQLKMKNAAETMVVDNENIFSETTNRYFHFGHTHVDSVIDTKLCRVESHRNLAPLNVWASNMGMRRQVGTMKSITYHTDLGEMSRVTFNVQSMKE